MVVNENGKQFSGGSSLIATHHRGASGVGLHVDGPGVRLLSLEDNSKV